MRHVLRPEQRWEEADVRHSVPLRCIDVHHYGRHTACAEVCPADAIKRTADGVVQSARKPRCIACNNCVLACPFGVPKMNTSMNLMMKCDMCYDRSSVGLKPMCASVCPSQALFFGTREEIETLRPLSRPVNEFQFGGQTITTKVKMMVPKEAPVERVDVTAAMDSTVTGQQMTDDILVMGLFAEEKS